jgi:hypothetical protein
MSKIFLKRSLIIILLIVAGIITAINTDFNNSDLRISI